MRRLAISISLSAFTFVLTACGDAGDHFGEFRQQPQPQNPATVAHMTIRLPTHVNRNGAAFPVALAAVDGNGFAIAPGTQLREPFTINSNAACSVTFNVDGTTGAAVTANSWPKTNIVATFKPSKIGCKTPSTVKISAYDLDATPQTVSVTFKS